MNESFKRGFINRAISAGLSKEAADELFHKLPPVVAAGKPSEAYQDIEKYQKNKEEEAEGRPYDRPPSDSSWFGRVMQHNADLYQGLIDRANPALRASTMLPFPMGPASLVIASGLMHGKDEASRDKNIARLQRTVQDRSLLRNSIEGAKSMGVGGALAGGAIGATPGLIKALMDITGTESGDSDISPLQLLLGGGLAGAGVGGLAGASGGATAGALSKIVANSTSRETKERARNLTAKHPYLSGLPFSSVIGATTV